MYTVTLLMLAQVQPYCGRRCFNTQNSTMELCVQLLPCSLFLWVSFSGFQFSRSAKSLITCLYLIIFKFCKLMISNIITEICYNKAKIIKLYLMFIFLILNKYFLGWYTYCLLKFLKFWSNLRILRLMVVVGYHLLTKHRKKKPAQNYTQYRSWCWHS